MPEAAIGAQGRSWQHHTHSHVLGVTVLRFGGVEFDSGSEFLTLLQVVAGSEFILL